LDVGAIPPVDSSGISSQLAGMTAADLRDRIVTYLVRNAGGSRMRWRRAVGDIRIYPLTTHPHCNWRIDPSGSAFEMEAVERAVDAVGVAHPFVDR
jgi:hypothetical protein